MIYNPHYIANREILKPVFPHQIQEVSIDLVVDKIYKIKQDTPLILTRVSKTEADKELLVPNAHGIYFLVKNNPYEVVCEQYIEVPLDMCCIIFGRSTLHKHGIHIASGIYDPGFKDFVKFTLFPFKDAYIAKGARIASMMFFKLSTFAENYFRPTKHKEEVLNVSDGFTQSNSESKD